MSRVCLVISRGENRRGMKRRAVHGLLEMERRGRTQASREGLGHEHWRA